MEDFERGRDSLLQALAVMRDDEEYRRKYGGIPDIVASRRETSIAVLCDMILRMKKEIDAKNKCGKLLEDVAGCWKLIQDDKQKMLRKMQELEGENVRLTKKVAQLLKTINANNNSNSRSSSIESWNGGGHAEGQERVSSGEESSGNQENYSNSMSDPAQFEEPSREMRVQPQPLITGLNQGQNSDDSCQQNNGATSSVSVNGTANNYARAGERNVDTVRPRFENNSTISANDNNPNNGQWSTSVAVAVASSSSSGGLDKALSSSYYAYPRLTINPYTSLDTSYYNPAQFFQRLSTSTARKTKSKRGGGGGGGLGRGSGKKTETDDPSSTSGEGKVIKKRATKSKAKKKDATIELDSGNQSTIGMDGSSINCEIMEQEDSNPRQNETPNPINSGESKEESPDKSFYDYTSTFLDETNSLLDI